MKLFQKYNKKLKKLGTSPIIATILLIGLTVFSGAVLYGVTTTYLNQKTPLALDYTNPTSFQSTITATNYKTATSNITTFNMQITNPSYEQVLLDTRDTSLINADTNQPTNWTVNSDSPYLLLNGRESTSLTFSVPNNNGTLYDTGFSLKPGTKAYVNFTIMRTDGSDSKIITTEPFTISAASPVFVFTPDSNYMSDTNVNTNVSSTIYFNAKQNETASAVITGVLWNYGNPDQSYQKTLHFYTNTSVFDIAPQYETQTLVVPSSNTITDPTPNQACIIGEACVNVTIPIVKKALNPNNTIDSYPGLLSITGMDFVSYSLNFQAPNISITLENTQRNNRGFWGWHGHRDSCYSFPNWDNNNQIYNQITFDGNPSCSDTKTVTFDIWNLIDTPISANIEIIGLNTTAFTLYTSANSNTWNNNGYDANPQYVNLPVANQGNTKWGWGKWIRNLDYCRFPDTQGCKTVTWGISRNALVNNNGESTGIMAGTYPVTIRDKISGYQITVDLVISPYYKTIHVDSLEGEYSHNTLQFNMAIKDSNGNSVGGVLIEASYTYPVGHKTKTTTEYLLTNRRGEATFSDWNPKSGKYTFEITNLQSPTLNRWSRWFSSTIYIYDKTADNPNPPTLTVRV